MNFVQSKPQNSGSSSTVDSWAKTGNSENSENPPSKSEITAVGFVSQKPFGSDERLCERTSRVIYRGIDEPDKIIYQKEDGFGVKVCLFWQAVAFFYTAIGSLYNIFAGDPVIYYSYVMLMFVEGLLFCFLILAIHNRSTSSRIYYLILQFFLFVMCSSEMFSEFETVKNLKKPSVFKTFFNFFSTSTICAALHFASLISSVEMLGSVSCEDYYADKIIIESVKHRKKKVYKLVADLLEIAAMEASATSMCLGVFNEQGQIVGLNGANLESSFSNCVGVKLAEKSVSLASVKTSCANVDVKKTSNENVVEPKVVTVLQNGGVNDCLKQPNHIDGKILE